MRTSKGGMREMGGWVYDNGGRGPFCMQFTAFRRQYNTKPNLRLQNFTKQLKSERDGSNQN